MSSSFENKMIDAFFQNMFMGADGVYGALKQSEEQSEEVALREKVAEEVSDDFMRDIAHSHSIPVMDCEVNHILEKLPRNAVIVDVGGCWGWHWRKLNLIRPDVKVIIIDFVRANLLHAKTLLGSLINEYVYLVHGDATKLELPDESVDCYWSVQALQHIPNYNKAIDEAFRVLKPGAEFNNYSLNNQWPIRKLYDLLGKNYVVKGHVDGAFFIERASNEQRLYIENIFANKVTERWSEILYKPELHIISTGKEGSMLGFIDSKLSNSLGLFKAIARQRSYHCVKKL